MGIALRSRRNGGRILGNLVGGAIGALLGLGLFVFGIWAWSRTNAARSWPTTPGIVDSSDISSSHSRKGGTKYRCNVRYHFEVNGVRYDATRLEPTGSSSGSNGAAQATKSRYPAGGPCTVHYDPDDPTVCCLELGGTGTAWVMIGLGAVFGLGSAFAIAKSVLPMGRM